MIKISKVMFIFLVFHTNLAFSQATKDSKILLGKTDLQVKEYFDELKKLFPNNPYVQTEKSTDKFGNLVLEFGTPTDSESLTNSLHVMATFRRVGGKEICVSELIFGSEVSSQTNLIEIKDSYKYLGDSKWNKSFNESFDILAQFSQMESKRYSINLSLELKSNKPN